MTVHENKINIIYKYDPGIHVLIFFKIIRMFDAFR
jgi:hypothetical protein